MITNSNTILIVDDNPINLSALFDFLEQSDMDIRIATNAKMALANAVYSPPDIILLDVMMPDMDGFETCKRLKENEATADIPIIFMTAISDSASELKGFELGAADYITKPIHIEKTYARIQTHLSLRNLQTQLKDKNDRLHREIRQRKKVEQTLRANEEKYRRLIETANSIILELDIEGRVTFFNKFAQSFFGYTEQEILGQNVIGTIVPEIETSGQDLRSLIANIQANPEQYKRNENESITKSGKRVWINWANELIYDTQGNAVGLLGVGVDDTERKQADKALHQSQERLRSFMDAATDYFTLFNADLTIIDINESASQTLGMNREELIGKNMLEVSPDIKDTERYELYLQVLKTGKPIAIDTLVFLPELGETHLAVKAFKVGDGLGVISTDITDRKQVEEVLEQAKFTAETANKAKSTFLANMSHELRSPLNAVLGFSQLMQRDTSLTDEQRNKLDIINGSGEHLLDLIDDILEMSKIEAGQINLIPTTLDFHHTLDTIESMIAIKANHKELYLQFERASDLPLYIETDARKLRQILINLLDNAVKFTENGGITLRVFSQIPPQSSLLKLEHQSNLEKTNHNNKQITLYFEIEDTGLGITPDELQFVFQPFVQTQSGQKSQKGTGLGLPISREFVKLMGGDIVVNSPVFSYPVALKKGGPGTQFSFYIQATVVKELTNQVQPLLGRVIGLEPGQPTYKILIVEDMAESRLLLGQLLKSVGFEVKEARNGQQGVEIYKKWQPDFIWMDIRMPIMDGYEAIKQIKATPTGKTTPIVALTANAFEEERITALVVGGDDFMRKPFREADIFNMMAKHLNIRYIYQDKKNKTVSREKTKNSDEAVEHLSPTPIINEAQIIKNGLAKLAPAWLTELQYALDIADVELMLELLQQLETDDNRFIELITNMINKFQFEKLSEWITELAS